MDYHQKFSVQLVVVIAISGGTCVVVALSAIKFKKKTAKNTLLYVDRKRQTDVHDLRLPDGLEIFRLLFVIPVVGCNWTKFMDRL